MLESGFTYDPMSGKKLDELEKLAKFEGYYDDAKAEFDSLRAKLSHNVGRDLERSKDDIKRLLEQDIVTAYYYQAGAIKAALGHDKQLMEAERLLADPQAYRSLLTPAKKREATPTRRLTGNRGTGEEAPHRLAWPRERGRRSGRCAHAPTPRAAGKNGCRHVTKRINKGKTCTFSAQTLAYERKCSYLCSVQWNEGLLRKLLILF